MVAVLADFTDIGKVLPGLSGANGASNFFQVGLCLGRENTLPEGQACRSSIA